MSSTWILPCQSHGPFGVRFAFDQVSSRFLAAMGFHFANFLPILLLPIDDLVDAVMTEKELSTEDPWWAHSLNSDAPSKLPAFVNYPHHWFVLDADHLRKFPGFSLLMLSPFPRRWFDWCQWWKKRANWKYLTTKLHLSEAHSKHFTFVYIT